MESNGGEVVAEFDVHLVNVDKIFQLQVWLLVLLFSYIISVLKINKYRKTVNKLG